MFTTVTTITYSSDASSDTTTSPIVIVLGIVIFTAVIAAFIIRSYDINRDDLGGG